MNISLKHLKIKCASCERSGLKMNKEHLFPEWLILRTNTNNTGIRWLSKKNISALKATIPLCRECNKIFGEELENPVSKLFDEIESEKGISDFDAELLIKWLWKIDGLSWICANPGKKYTELYTLKERVLKPINSIRKDLLIAVSLIKDIHPESTDLPMGIDSSPLKDAIFVSGVFSKIAIIVTLNLFEDLIPSCYSIYKMASKRDELSNVKLFYPQYGFKDDVKAVGKTVLISRILSKKHDQFFEYIQSVIN